MAGTAEATVKSAELRCETCGGPWEMRGFQTTRTIACEYCGSIFDVRGEMWQLVQKVEEGYRTKPRYALGTRGRLDGIEWEVIGWMRRSIRSFGQVYAWEEHLLYNPYEGFRYLIYQDGHFVVVTPLTSLPNRGLNRAAIKGRTYKHFSTASAEVDEVMGEFPWEVRRGDVARATDYVAPPRILSSEESQGELVWSEGRYLPREEVVQAFGEPTRRPRSPSDPHPCEANPHKPLANWLLMAALGGLAMWFVLTLVYFGARENKQVWVGNIGDGQDVELTLNTAGSGSTLEVTGKADVNNNWVYLDCMLVNTQEQTASHIGLEISYYHGYSGGESWSEGSRSSSTTVSGIKNGKYILQVTRHPGSKYKGPVSLSIRRDVGLYRYPICTLLLLLIVPGVVIARSLSFEKRRWQQSDHAS